MRVLFEEYGTQLVEAAGGRLVLNVLCGGIAQFGVEFTLNDEEAAAYRAQGDAYVQNLAYRVTRSPESFAARGRYC